MRIMIEKKKKKKSDISNLVTNSNLSTKLGTLAAKAESKAEQDKIVKLETFDFSVFIVRFIC